MCKHPTCGEVCRRPKKVKTRIKRKSSLPLPKLMHKAQDIFNAYIRLRDSELPCIACGLVHEHYDAGHYVPVKGGSFLRYNEDNVNKEGKSCNGFDAFHLIGYRKNLIAKIGIERVEFLEANRSVVKKWTREELEFIITEYSQRLKTLKAA